MWQKGRETPTFPPKHVREHISNWPQNYSHTYFCSHRPHSFFPAAQMKIKTEVEQRMVSRQATRCLPSVLIMPSCSHGYIWKDLSGGWVVVCGCGRRCCCCCWHHNLRLISCLLKTNRSKMNMVLFHPRTLTFPKKWEFGLAPLAATPAAPSSKDQASAWISRRSFLVYPPCTCGLS